MKTAWALGGLVVIVMAAACGGSSGGSGDPADAAPGVDGVAVPPDGAADGAAIDAVPADAGPTTFSGWTAAAGLPETACVPWVLTDTAEPENPVVSEGVLTLGDDSNAEQLYYSHPDEVLAMPPVLVIEATLQFVSGASITTSRTAAGIQFSLDDDRKNLFFVGDGVVFLLSAENTRGVEAAVATTDRAHTYRIEVDTVSGAVQVFQDDVSVLTSTLFVSPYDVADGIYWGEASQVANGTALWTSVTHNALVPVACP